MRKGYVILKYTEKKESPQRFTQLSTFPVIRWSNRGMSINWDLRKPAKQSKPKTHNHY